MYPYITLADDTLITHSRLLNEGENKTVEVHFERPKVGGFDSATYTIPSYEQTERIGYTDDEICEFEELLRNHAHLFFEYAESGGIGIS